MKKLEEIKNELVKVLENETFQRVSEISGLPNRELIRYSSIKENETTFERHYGTYAKTRTGKYKRLTIDDFSKGVSFSSHEDYFIFDTGEDGKANQSRDISKMVGKTSATAKEIKEGKADYELGEILREVDLDIEKFLKNKVLEMGNERMPNPEEMNRNNSSWEDIEEYWNKIKNYQSDIKKSARTRLKNQNYENSEGRVMEIGEIGCATLTGIVFAPFIVAGAGIYYGNKLISKIRGKEKSPRERVMELRGIKKKTNHN